MPPRTLRYTVVDAFTQTPFRGNPAAVVVFDDPADQLQDAALQLIAREFNLSETAYVTRTQDPNVYHLCWFTPTTEVILCGHATLASAHVVFDQLLLPTLPPHNEQSSASTTHSGFQRTITFQTRKGAGSVTVRQLSGPNAGRLELNFPAGVLVKPDDALVEQTRSVMAAALPGVPHDLVKDVAICTGTMYTDFILIHVDDEFDLSSANVQAGQLAQLNPYVVAILTNSPAHQRKEAGIHFVSRVFGPLIGIDEDPVTGSAHCVLAPYWSQRLGVSGPLSARQVSARGGELEVEWLSKEGVVQVRGYAAVSASGQMAVPTGSQ